MHCLASEHKQNYLFGRASEDGPGNERNGEFNEKFVWMMAVCVCVFEMRKLNSTLTKFNRSDTEYRSLGVHLVRRAVQSLSLFLLN